MAATFISRWHQQHSSAGGSSNIHQQVAATYISRWQQQHSSAGDSSNIHQQVAAATFISRWQQQHSQQQGAAAKFTATGGNSNIHSNRWQQQHSQQQVAAGTFTAAGATCTAAGATCTSELTAAGATFTTTGAHSQQQEQKMHSSRGNIHSDIDKTGAPFTAAAGAGFVSNGNKNCRAATASRCSAMTSHTQQYVSSACWALLDVPLLAFSMRP